MSYIHNMPYEEYIKQFDFKPSKCNSCEDWIELIKKISREYLSENDELKKLLEDNCNNSCYRLNGYQRQCELRDKEIVRLRKTILENERDNKILKSDIELLNKRLDISEVVNNENS